MDGGLMSTAVSGVVANIVGRNISVCASFHCANFLVFKIKNVKMHSVYLMHPRALDL